MDDKRLEFVAMMLAGEGIQHLNPDAIRKRVRKASAAYDIMVEELGDLFYGKGQCRYCEYYCLPDDAEPCYNCSKDHINWTRA